MQVNLFNGMKAFTHSDEDYISRSLKQDGVWEPNISHWITALSQKGTFIDIGANIGYFSLIGSRHYAKVYAFEPLKKNYDKLYQSISANDISNITVVTSCAGDIHDSQMELVSFPTNMGGSRNLGVTKKHNVSHMKQINEGVHRIVSLDTYVADNQITDIDMIKIDVEGFEPEVLHGFKNGLAKRSAKYIILELSPYMTDRNKCIGLISLLKLSGYYIYDIGLYERGSKILACPYKNITEIEHGQFVDSIRQTNILASYREIG
jgi:FkbM family methyltransferase